MRKLIPPACLPLPALFAARPLDWYGIDSGLGALLAVSPGSSDSTGKIWRVE